MPNTEAGLPFTSIVRRCSCRIVTGSVCALAPIGRSAAAAMPESNTWRRDGIHMMVPLPSMFYLMLRSTRRARAEAPTISVQHLGRHRAPLLLNLRGAKKLAGGNASHSLAAANGGTGAG